MPQPYSLAKLSMQIESDEKAAYYTTELMIAEEQPVIVIAGIPDPDTVQAQENTPGE
jgi:hypothetical protein